ncbi:MAG TPA: pyrroline-5-carboxylate reductase [Candidatus Alistipes excrementipullorum]|nr:pyrroline-5-carboxylate reductase [Candidatus Alistipes excrementipullorum]
MKIAVIGGGNMGGSIARGAVKRGAVEARNVTVSDPSDKVLGDMAAFDPQIVLTKDNAAAVAGADIVFVAVKPWLVETVMGQIRDALDYSRQKVVSIAAGVTFEMLAGYLRKASGEEPVLFRVIPNTAISLGLSVTFVAERGASQEDSEMLRALLSRLGEVLFVSEEMMVSGTALASCGIAYALKYIDAAMRGGEELGFSERESLQVVMQTMRGALSLLETNGTLPQQEIDKVTTPGGITLKGLAAMKEAGFDEAVTAGLKAGR